MFPGSDKTPKPHPELECVGLANLQQEANGACSPVAQLLDPNPNPSPCGHQWFKNKSNPNPNPIPTPNHRRMVQDVSKPYIKKRQLPPQHDSNQLTLSLIAASSQSFDYSSLTLTLAQGTALTLTDSYPGQIRR